MVLGDAQPLVRSHQMDSGVGYLGGRAPCSPSCRLGGVTSAPPLAAASRSAERPARSRSALLAVLGTVLSPAVQYSQHLPLWSCCPGVLSRSRALDSACQQGSCGRPPAARRRAWRSLQATAPLCARLGAARQEAAAEQISCMACICNAGCQTASSRMPDRVRTWATTQG